MEVYNSLNQSSQGVPNMAVPSTPNRNISFQLVYPEIFYQLQPFVIVACDQLDSYGSAAPTQEMVEQYADSICNKACQVYPELTNYNNNQSGNDDSPLGDYGQDGLDLQPFFHHDFFIRRFRRRGSLQDLVTILLLSELFRRRRMGY